MKKPRVLFICTHNSARSQMAEAFLRKHGSDRFEAHSAGLEATEIHPYTRQVMTEAGIDLTGQQANDIAEYLVKIHIGYAITVCSKAERLCPVFPGPVSRLHWPFEDPASFEGTEEDKLAKFREVRDQIEERIMKWLEE
jgi:arsenate reductase (thioredoxin)